MTLIVISISGFLVEFFLQKGARTRAFFFYFSSCLLLLITMLRPSYASNAPQLANDFSLGLSALSFHYKEFSPSGALLDREDGWLPGVTISSRFSDRYGNFVEGVVSLHSGEVIYDGQLQNGTPYKTYSYEDIRDEIVRFSVAVDQHNNAHFSAGLGYHYWYRRIQSNNRRVSDLVETYRWHYGMAGFDIYLSRRASWQSVLDFRLTKILAPEMEVRIEGFDPAYVDLGQGFGHRLALRLTNLSNATTPVSIEFYVEEWKLGESAWVSLTSNGSTSNVQVREPDSSTRNYGLNITASF